MVVVEVVVVIMLLLQVQNSTRTVVNGIRSALDASNAQSLTEISLLQNSTVAIISSMSAAIARIFADSAVQLSLFKNTTTFLLDDVYGDFVALAAESDAEQKEVLNATDFLVADINDNTKWAVPLPAIYFCDIFPDTPSRQLEQGDRCRSAVTSHTPATLTRFTFTALLPPL